MFRKYLRKIINELLAEHVDTLYHNLGDINDQFDQNIQENDKRFYELTKKIDELHKELKIASSIARASLHKLH